MAYGSAGVKNTPVEVVSADDPIIAQSLEGRLDLVRGEGQYVVIVKSAERAAAQQQLYDYGLIKGVQLGR